MTDNEYEQYVLDRVSSPEFIGLTRIFHGYNVMRIPEDCIPFTKENWYRCHMNYWHIPNFWNEVATIIYKLEFNDEYPNGKLDINSSDKKF